MTPPSRDLASCLESCYDPDGKHSSPVSQLEYSSPTTGTSLKKIQPHSFDVDGSYVVSLNIPVPPEKKICKAKKPPGSSATFNTPSFGAEVVVRNVLTLRSSSEDDGQGIDGPPWICAPVLKTDGGCYRPRALEPHTPNKKTPSPSPWGYIWQFLDTRF